MSHTAHGIDFERLLEGVGDAIVVVGHSGAVVYVNAAAERLFGWPREDLLRKPLTKLMPERMHAAHVDGFARYLTTRKPTLIGGAPVRVPAKRSDGSEVEVELSLRTIDAPDHGELIIACLRDLTMRAELERAEQARARAEALAANIARLQAVTEALSETLTTEQVAGTVMHHALDAFEADTCTLYALSRDGSSLQLLGDGHGCAPEIIARIREISASDPINPAALVLRSKDIIFAEDEDEYAALVPSLAKMHVPGQRAKAFWCAPLLIGERSVGALGMGFYERHRFSKDDRALIWTMARQCAQALDRARLYGELERSYREAAEANQLKDEFLATMSHELRTPLNAILGWATMLKGDWKRAPFQLAKGLATIERNALAQVKLIEDVLDVSRIVAGKFRLEPKSIDLAHVLGAALDVVRPMAEAKNIRLETAIANGPLSTFGDPDRLQQVAWNLLSNAVKFTPNGGTVYVGSSRDGSKIRIVVRDTGLGFSEVFRPFLFDRFRQADSSTTRQNAGLGLGLAITRHIVELHGGTIEATSAGKNCGAAFMVEIPILANPGSSDPKPADEGLHLTARSEKQALSGLKVLVCDDDPDSRELVTAFVRGAGGEVTAVGSAVDALRVFRHYRPDVIVSDIGMPEVDGYALLRKIRALPAEEGGRTPALALTAYARRADARKAIAAGYQAHAAKPVHAADLVALVANLGGRVASA